MSQRLFGGFIVFAREQYQINRAGTTLRKAAVIWHAMPIERRLEYHRLAAQVSRKYSQRSKHRNFIRRLLGKERGKLGYYVRRISEGIVPYKDFFIAHNHAMPGPLHEKQKHMSALWHQYVAEHREMRFELVARELIERRRELLLAELSELNTVLDEGGTRGGDDKRAAGDVSAPRACARDIAADAALPALSCPSTGTVTAGGDAAGSTRKRGSKNRTNTAMIRLASQSLQKTRAASRAALETGTRGKSVSSNVPFSAGNRSRGKAELQKGKRDKVSK